MSIEIELKDNSKEFLDELYERTEQALIAIGLTAESNAKKEITRAVYDTPQSPDYKRTGRLRNSITFAISGEGAHTSAYKDDNNNSYSYSGTAPQEGIFGTGLFAGGKKAVYIGTNVEYAAAVELGSSRQKARPYLKPAIENYVDEYKRLAEEALKGGV